LIDAAGAIVAAMPEESVTYAEERPNGPDCPGSCRVAYRGGF
jgi:hypothetical protein